jgi:CBS domain-containing protein
MHRRCLELARCGTRRIGGVSSSGPELSEGLVVADVMLREPKTLPAGATVGQVRRLLEKPSVQMVLLADEGVFSGAVTELPAAAPDGESALGFADLAPVSLGPGESASAAFELAARLPHRRVVVLDEQRNLLGLLCLNSARTRFCGVPTKPG